MLKTVSFKMEDYEVRALKKYLRRHNQTMSSFLRELILDKIEEEISPEFEKELIKAREEANKL